MGDTEILPLDDSEIIRDARELQYALDVILHEDLKCEGTVSLACCYDVVTHHKRDMERLYAVHQELVHPSKHVAYTAFWIRKLKPVDSSYSIQDLVRAETLGEEIDPSLEVRDINERICVHYATLQIIALAKRGEIQPPDGLSPETYLQALDRAFERFFAGRSSGPILTDQFEAVVYDMRYRTFGPHHVVHLVNHLLSEASYGND